MCETYWLEIFMLHFFGIFDRYEDFVVHEINEANEVIHLTNLSCPAEEKVCFYLTYKYSHLIFIVLIIIVT